MRVFRWAASFAAVAVAPFAAAVASSRCDGYLVATRRTCMASSANLSASECSAWQDLFCNTNGNDGTGTWSQCLHNINDPCSCKFVDVNGRLRGVECEHHGNGTSNIVQIDLSGGYASLVGKLLPTITQRLEKLSLIDLTGNLITGVLLFDAHTNLYQRRILSDTAMGTISTGQENWPEPAYSPFDGAYHIDDADVAKAQEFASQSESFPFGLGRAAQNLEEQTMSEIANKQIVLSEAEALRNWVNGSEGIVGTKEPLEELQMLEMLELQQNFMYVCTLCPVKIPTPVPTDPKTKLPVPTPAPDKLSEEELCLKGTCSFRLFFGAPCDEPSASCLSTPTLKIGVGAPARDMSLFDKFYREDTMRLVLNTSTDGQGFVELAGGGDNSTAFS